MTIQSAFITDTDEWALLRESVAKLASKYVVSGLELDVGLCSSFRPSDDVMNRLERLLEARGGLFSAGHWYT